MSIAKLKAYARRSNAVTRLDAQINPLPKCTILTVSSLRSVKVKQSLVIWMEAPFLKYHTVTRGLLSPSGKTLAFFLLRKMKSRGYIGDAGIVTMVGKSPIANKLASNILLQFANKHVRT